MRSVIAVLILVIVFMAIDGIKVLGEMDAWRTKAREAEKEAVMAKEWAETVQNEAAELISKVEAGSLRGPVDKTTEGAHAKLGEEHQ